MQEDLDNFYTHGFVVETHDHGMEVADVLESDDDDLHTDLSSMKNQLNDDLQRRLAQFEADDDVAEDDCML